MPPPKGGKLSRSELERLGFGPRTERYRAGPGDPRAVKGTISRRQAENEAYTAGGWRNRADYERRYQGQVGRRYARFESEALLQGKVTSRVAAPGSHFSQLWTAYRGNPRNRRPTGPLAKLLVYIGLRDEGANYPVGATPPKRG